MQKILLDAEQKMAAVPAPAVTELQNEMWYQNQLL